MVHFVPLIALEAYRIWYWTVRQGLRPFRPSAPDPPSMGRPSQPDAACLLPGVGPKLETIIENRKHLMTIAITGATGQLGPPSNCHAEGPRRAADRPCARSRQGRRPCRRDPRLRLCQRRSGGADGRRNARPDLLERLQRPCRSASQGDRRRPERLYRAHHLYLCPEGRESPMILAHDHIATEAAVRDSSIAATILRNGWYTENYTGALAQSSSMGQSSAPQAAVAYPPPPARTMRRRLPSPRSTPPCRQDP